MHLDMTDQGSWLCLNWIFGEEEKRISQWKCDKHHSFLCSWTCLHESYLGIKKKAGKAFSSCFLQKRGCPTEIHWGEINLLSTEKFHLRTNKSVHANLLLSQRKGKVKAREENNSATSRSVKKEGPKPRGKERRCSGLGAENLLQVKVRM